ncbi:MAG: protein-L-isoaspartate(D-aspartate) O-methyltransferase [Halovenus sp.]
MDEERAALVERLRAREDVDSDTAAAMEAVPRHEFLPASKRDRAYADTPLPIGEGQTISAPHMVAIMTDLLKLQPGLTVLEIGTGCGYHAAVTAERVGAENVFTVEYHDSLAQRARETLARTGYGDVSVRTGDGRNGWPEHAPYDRAYLTCAASSFPDPVVDQVRPGGILLAPIGDYRQRLVRARKEPDGSLDRESHGGVRFVPLQ